MDYVMSSINDLQTRQQERISQMENMLTTQTHTLGFPHQEEYKWSYNEPGGAASDRLIALPLNNPATRRATDV